MVAAAVVVAAADFVAEPDDDDDVGTDVVVIVVLLVPLVTVKVTTVAGVDALDAGVLETEVLLLLLLLAATEDVETTDEEAETTDEEDEEAGFCTVLNVVATGTDTAVVIVAAVVVDNIVLGRTLTVLGIETLLIVELGTTETTEELVAEFRLENDDAVVLAVLDTALPPTTPPRTVESSGCVVAEVRVEVEVLLVPVL